MTEHAVVIAGGGPTGRMLAGELALAGVDVAIVERRASQDLTGSRAGGLHSRTIEVLDQRGIADRFLSQGQVAQVVRFHSIPLGPSPRAAPTPASKGLSSMVSSLQNSHSNGSERGANSERARIAHGDSGRGCLKPHKPRADAGHRCAYDGQFARPRDVLKLKMMGKNDMPGQVGGHT